MLIRRTSGFVTSSNYRRYVGQVSVFVQREPIDLDRLWQRKGGAHNFTFTQQRIVLFAETLVDFTKPCEASQLDLPRIILRNSQRGLWTISPAMIRKLRGVSWNRPQLGVFCIIIVSVCVNALSWRPNSPIWPCRPCSNFMMVSTAHFRWSKRRWHSKSIISCRFDFKRHTPLFV